MYQPSLPRKCRSIVRMSAFIWPCFLTLSVSYAQQNSSSVRSFITWVDGKPQVNIELNAEAPEALKEVKVPVALHDDTGKRIWRGTATIPLAKDKPANASLALGPRKNERAIHCAKVRLYHRDLNLTYSEDIYFSTQKPVVQSYSIRKTGAFPDERVDLVLRLQETQDKNSKDTQLSIALSDRDNNRVAERVKKIPWRRGNTELVEEVTPEAEQSIGPFRLEVGLANEAMGLDFLAELEFAYANVLLPVSSFELQGAEWFPSGYAPHTHTSFQFKNVEKYTYPEVIYDREARRSGGQSLRISYVQGRGGHIYTRQQLPGLSLAAHFWVKGNGSRDKLVVVWADRINYERAFWLRNQSFSRNLICTLDFEGWRRFRVPVLGEGLQALSAAGSTKAIDGPISILCLIIQPEPLKKGQKEAEKRSLWLDDILAETQARKEELISLELRADTTDRRLHKEARITASLGNGLRDDIGNGRLTMTVKDRTGRTVLTRQQTVGVTSGEFATAEFALADVFAKPPPGPIDVDLAFVDPLHHGVKQQRRITLKYAASEGLFLDFENEEPYRSFSLKGRTAVNNIPGALRHDKEVRTVVGGAEGSRKCLRLQVRPKGELTGVVLHPVLPGIVDTIALQVKGGSRPVMLQGFLIDEGRTGICFKNYNLLHLDPVEIDWQDWRKVVLKAPPVPAYYNVKGRTFFNKPSYPVNLAVAFHTASDEPVEVWIDGIRVKTHLEPDDELVHEVIYPNPTRIHPPGAPLEIAFTNYASREKRLRLNVRLESFQERTVAAREMELRLPPGERKKAQLIKKLDPGFYSLRVEGLAGKAIEAVVQVLDVRKYFGDDPLETMTSLIELRRSLNLMKERITIDWDNTEPVPHLFLYGWFKKYSEDISRKGAYTLVPVLGFSSDYAGPDARDSLQKGTYLRTIANPLQTPVDLNDWNRYVRECLREYKDRFDEWVFWENPDLKDAPQGITPNKYREMLNIVHKWVKLYAPKSKVVAGGFNFDHALNYLERIEGRGDLRFDEIGVRMNIGELAPERADIEGFLDEMDDLLKLRETGRRVRISELDWGIGQYLSPLQQAAYHVRASLLLNSRNASRHRFSVLNSDEAFHGYGVFYRTRYGNTENVQTVRPHYLPKPSYFALVETQEFLAQWKFVKEVYPPDQSLENNRALIYRNSAGELAAVIWRAVSGPRLYQTPASWKRARASDAFGIPVAIEGVLKSMTLPIRIYFPKEVSLEQLSADIRNLIPSDGKDTVLLDLHLAEPDSCRRAAHEMMGEATKITRTGRIPGGRKIRETVIEGIEQEQFRFRVERAGIVLLKRLWYFGKSQQLHLSLNSGRERPWDLTEGEVNYLGVRESTFLLTGCKAGMNSVSIRYGEPGNCAGYRVEPVERREVRLTRWGILNARQSKGEVQTFKNAAGAPLTIRKTPYHDGLGAHSTSFIEYPLNRQFSSFAVTVGVDGSTDGRGTVIFEVHVDGQEAANTGLMNGFTEPRELRIENLEDAERMILVVRDGGDGEKDDLANWVDGKLWVK